MWSRDPMLIAIEKGTVELVDLLFRNGFKLKDNSPDSLLIPAIRRCDVRLVEYLVDHGVNIETGLMVCQMSRSYSLFFPCG